MNHRVLACSSASLKLLSQLNEVILLKNLAQKKSRSTLIWKRSYSSKTNSFVGLDGTSPCASKTIEGAEPTYNLANNTFKVFECKKPVHLKHGVIPELQVAYETYGELNKDNSNAILIFTGLSANSHAKSSESNPNPGWWEKFIGEKCAIDTKEFFVICCNHIGSCFGSSGPSSINPLTKKPYATTFPIITVKDMIDVQFMLLEHLGIDKLHASIGSSLGGMCSLTSGIYYPQKISRIISISSCLRATASSIAMRYLQRKAIMSDRNWKNGFYYSSDYPLRGIKLAREIATTTYRSGPEWNLRFGRKKIDENEKITLCPTFAIENYLDYQGDSFSTKYDPNSLLYLSKAMDLFDAAEGFDSTTDALANIKCPVMVIGVQTDALFPVTQQREVAEALKDSGNDAVTYFELDSIYGHDTFLLNINDVGTAIKGFLETCLPETGDLSKSKLKKL